MSRKSSCLNNDRGTALVLVLTMLAVLMVLCVLALENSTLEVKISGNYRASQESLYAAERAGQYALDNLADGLDLNADKAPGGERYYKDDIRIGKGALDLTEANGVTRIGSGPPPAGSGMDATTASGFQAIYYAVEVHGQYPEGAPNPSRSGVEMQVGRIVAK